MLQVVRKIQRGFLKPLEILLCMSLSSIVLQTVKMSEIGWVRLCTFLNIGVMQWRIQDGAFGANAPPPQEIAYKIEIL